MGRLENDCLSIYSRSAMAIYEIMVRFCPPFQPLQVSNNEYLQRNSP
jgi:hypothetical protein